MGLPRGRSSHSGAGGARGPGGLGRRHRSPDLADDGHAGPPDRGWTSEMPIADFEAQQQLTRELMSGERLLWAGRPRQGVFARPFDVFLIPFGLFWCGLSIFWEAAAFSSHEPPLVRLSGLPFVLIGLYMVFGRFLLDARQR